MRKVHLTLALSLCALASQAMLISPATALAIYGTDPRYSVVSWGPGRLDVFVIKAGKVWVRSFENTWTGWSPMASVPGTKASIDAVSWGPGRIDVVVGSNYKNETGKLDSVWHKYLDINSGNVSWQPSGNGEYLGGSKGQFADGIQAVSWGPNRLDVFPLQARYYQENEFVHKYWNGSAWMPSQTGFYVVGPDVPNNVYFHVAASGIGRLHAFRFTENFSGANIHHNRTSGSLQLWNGWSSINGGMARTMPYAISSSSNVVEVFIRGMDDAIWRDRYEAGAHNGWYWIGPGDTQNWSAPTAVSWGSGRVDIFEHRDTANYGDIRKGIFHKWRDGNTWGPTGETGEWADLGDGPFMTPNYAPAAVSWGYGRIDLFLLGDDGNIYHKWTNDGSNWGPSQTDWESLGAPNI